MAEKDALVGQMENEEPNQETTSPEAQNMQSLLEQEGLGLDLPRKGETRKGIIASITDNEILVSVGAKSEGVIYAKELERMGEEERASLKVGQEIPVYIVTTEDKNGNLMLSYTRAQEAIDWDLAEKLKETQEAYESKIVGYNKGGLIVSIGKLRGFVPASLVSMRRLNTAGETPEERWGNMVNEPIKVCVIEVDRERRRLILSEKAAIQETRESLKDQLLDELKVGDVRTGRVTSLANFGAFVNIEGADGLVHLSEISWERIEHPKEVLKIGQEVQVKVISIDQDKKRIGLSIRQLQDDPWIKRVEQLREGQLIEGTITHLTKFGAFASLGEDDLEGLIHISELSDKRIEHPKEVVSEGEIRTLRIIKIDQERRRIGLSLRKVDSAAYADLDWKLLGDEIEEVQGIIATEENEATEIEAPTEEAQEIPETENAPESDSATEDEAAEPETIPEEGEVNTPPPDEDAPPEEVPETEDAEEEPS